MKIIFDWDRRKAHINRQKHQVSFEEASSVFFDPFVFTSRDEEHSDQEERFISVGTSQAGRLLVVIHTQWYEAPDTTAIRIISSRRATGGERQRYDRQAE
jgi:uncharacterized DUF497 family protein